MFREWLSSFIVTFVSVLFIILFIVVAGASVAMLLTLPTGLNVLGFAIGVAILFASWALYDKFDDKFKAWVKEKVGDDSR